MQGGQRRYLMSKAQRRQADRERANRELLNRLTSERQAWRLGHIASSWELSMQVLEGTRAAPRTVRGAEQVAGVSMRGGREPVDRDPADAVVPEMLDAELFDLTEGG